MAQAVFILPYVYTSISNEAQWSTTYLAVICEIETYVCRLVPINSSGQGDRRCSHLKIDSGFVVMAVDSTTRQLEVEACQKISVSVTLKQGLICSHFT